MGRPDALVIGGGAVGCAVAFHLAREGLAVRLLEAETLAGGASGAAAGMITPVAEAPEGGPLLAWGLRALDGFPALAEELRGRSGVDPELERSGVLRVAADADEERALRALAARHEALGLGWLAPRELAALGPGLAEGLRGGVLSPREAHLQSRLLVRAYAGAASALGARIQEGVPVRGLARAGERVIGARLDAETVHAGAVVLCAGVHAPALVEEGVGGVPGDGAGGGAADGAEAEGMPGSETEAAGRAAPRTPALPVRPVRGQIVRLESPFGSGASGGPIVWGRGAYLVPKRDGSVVLGATMEHAGFDRRVTADGVRRLLEAGVRLRPGLAGASFLGAWAGLRPATPDHRPAIGPWPGAPGLVVATGHHRAGVQLSSITGEIVRDGLLGKGWAEPAFLPERLVPGAAPR